MARAPRILQLRQAGRDVRSSMGEGPQQYEDSFYGVVQMALWDARPVVLSRGIARSGPRKGPAGAKGVLPHVLKLQRPGCF